MRRAGFRRGSRLSVQRSSSDQTTIDRKTVNDFKAGLDANWAIDLSGANQSALKASEATA